MEHKGLLVEEKEAKGVSCQHYWVIEFPGGPMSRGICRLCGDQREFQNSMDGYLREDNMWSYNLRDSFGDLGSYGGVD